MSAVVYSMSTSLDGFVKDADGGFGWSVPDAELHRYHNARVREVGVQLLGRRLYETMVYWETAHEDPAAGPIVLEFAAIWQALPKVVFSSSLTSVVGARTRLATGTLAEEVARARSETDGDVAIGGAALAASAIALDLVDELQPFVCPVVVGGGTPFIPPTERRLDFELVETRTFGLGVVHSRYRRVR
jgi:dihydrofolate reductase